MLINIVALLGGLVVLVYSADRFVDGASSIAKNFGVSPLLIGLTIVGLGTSAPEILVSVIASLQGNTGLAIGNALGSNIANIGLILGATALIIPLSFHSQLLKRELPILIFTSLLCYGLAFDGLGEVDAIIMLTGLVVFLCWLIWSAKNNKTKNLLSEEIEQELPERLPVNKAWTFFFLGLVGLLCSSKLLVWAAVNIAEIFGVSDLVIGLTIVALGTSLPELAASITSVMKKEDDLAVGNVIGSNMYNLLAVYSLPGLLSPGPVGETVLSRDFPVMLVFTIGLFILGYGIPKSESINRIEGGVLLTAYLAYQWMVFQTAVV
jgi:cation:H+ antiporter